MYVLGKPSVRHFSYQIGFVLGPGNAETLRVKKVSPLLALIYSGIFRSVIRRNLNSVTLCTDPVILQIMTFFPISCEVKGYPQGKQSGRSRTASRAAGICRRARRLLLQAA